MKVIVSIIIFSLLTSCLVTSKKYNEVITRSSASKIVIDNQNNEIEKLKTDNKKLISENLLLIEDTIRLSRNIYNLKEEYTQIIEDGASTTIATKRKAREFEDEVRRNDNLIRNIKDDILERNSKINLIESKIVSEYEDIVNKIDDAIIYQTKSGVTIELNDSAISTKENMSDSIKQFIVNITPFIINEKDISIVIQSYVLKQDSSVNITDVWSESLKKGESYATIFIDCGVTPDKIDIISTSAPYPYTNTFIDGSRLITKISFNLDASHIIDMFDSLVKGKNK